ncbi:hypothetical protein J6590_051244 [Homalodisca vitripennis]|nr:hypothetical protein J6590_051244 [Homalodisca vitripennis]
MIGNVPDNNKQEDPAPKTSSRKAEMVKWLSGLKETCDSITQEDWRKTCDHTIVVEQAYMELKRQINEMTEQIAVRLVEDSDSDEWVEESGSHYPLPSGRQKEPIVDTSDRGEDDLAGIVPFYCY